MLNVIVTGASRGLGLGITTTLAAGGYQVIAVARTQSAPLGAAIARARDAGPGAIQFRALDLLQTAAILASNLEPPVFKCPNCGGALEFDDLPERYFAFLDDGD